MVKPSITDIFLGGNINLLVSRQNPRLEAETAAAVPAGSPNMSVF